MDILSYWMETSGKVISDCWIHFSLKGFAHFFFLSFRLSMIFKHFAVYFLWRWKHRLTNLCFLQWLWASLFSSFPFFYPLSFLSPFFLLLYLGFLPGFSSSSVLALSTWMVHLIKVKTFMALGRCIRKASNYVGCECLCSDGRYTKPVCHSFVTLLPPLSGGKIYSVE